MTIRFDNQVALITGAGNGLGRSHALYLASRGAKIVVNDIGAALDGTERSKWPAQRVVDEIKAKGGEAIANFDSVSEIEGAQNMIDVALKHFGTLDILINNAGVIRDKTFIKMPLKDFEFVIKVHLMGTIYVTKAVVKIMKDNNFGRIIMTTSGAGLFGNFGQTNYSAAKMALVGFMNSLKLEGAKYNILVNTISPMAITRMAQRVGIFPEPIAHRLKPELISAMVAYLCSKECQTSGDIISAAGPYYGKVQVVEGPGMCFDYEEEVTPEKIAAHYAQITATEGAIAFKNTREEIMAICQRIGSRCEKEKYNAKI